MRDFKNRLVEFARKRYDMGQTRFEEKCGIHPGTISAIKANGPTASVVTKIASACPELNLNWLYTGTGDMLNGERRTVDEIPAMDGDRRPLPLLPIDAVAGPGDPVYEDAKVEDFYFVSEFKECDFLIRVKGDSMVPKFAGGDLLACRKVTDVYFLQWNRCYVIYTRSQGVMVKRIQPSEKEGCIKCVSENAKYAPFDVPTDDIVSVALVNGAITLE